MDDVAQVGGKNASLGEMIQHLGQHGVPVPSGFAITADGYWRFVNANGLRQVISDLLSGLDVQDVHDLAIRGEKVREKILHATIPDDLREAIAEAYRALGDRDGHALDVAVRSSATAEDLPTASFAGQQESYLNIRGEEELLDAVRRCFASLFTNRAIAYRVEQKFDHLKVALSVGVQRMIRSDLASAGVMFTIDTETGFEQAILVNGSYGLGESVVQGKVNPDQFMVFKPTLKDGFHPIVSRVLGKKETKILYGKNDHDTRTMPTSMKDRTRFCLTDAEVETLATYAITIESYYSVRAGHLQPMDIEWAKDGETGKLWIVQARPETVQSQRDHAVLEEYILEKTGEVLIHGLAVGSRIGQGHVRIMRSLKDMDAFQDGDVLVAHMTDPDWVPIMKRASAIVTDSGGRTCHAAIVARELGTPALVGTGNATTVLKAGTQVTVSCAEGDEGKVYEGLLPFQVKRTPLDHVPKTRTRIQMNLADPSAAFEQSMIPNEGVGLMRLEFVFTNHVGIHPMAVLHPELVKEPAVRAKIQARIAGYPDGKTFIVNRLAEGIGQIAAAFYPKEVIVRASDFKTNEYANLLGGKAFEPAEANPMIGWRGASRYYDPGYKEAFLLECAAFRKVREEMGLKNLVLMVPFCRTPEEGEAVLKVMAEAGLKQGKDGLQVYVMVEIPSNVILAEQFADLFDGFSIGSNDLTQLTLGVDRDSAIVSRVYDEQNEAVLASIRHVISVAKHKGVKVGICGQAPSDNVHFAEFLVREGIDSMSLNPDTVIKTTMAVAKLEKQLKK